jgi:hypothetical protein
MASWKESGAKLLPASEGKMKDQRSLAGRRPASDEDVLPFHNGHPQQLGLAAGHDTGLDVIFEGEDSDCASADGEARRGNDGRRRTLEPFPDFRQFGRDTRRAGMDLNADMMGDQPHDSLGVGGGDAATRILEATR